MTHEEYLRSVINSGLIGSLAAEWAIQKIDTQAAQLAAIEKMLIPHTVGGSEYIGDPLRCAQAVVQTLQSVKRFKHRTSDALSAQAKISQDLREAIQNIDMIELLRHGRTDTLDTALAITPTEAEAQVAEWKKKAEKWDAVAHMHQSTEEAKKPHNATGEQEICPALASIAKALRENTSLLDRYINKWQQDKAVTLDKIRPDMSADDVARVRSEIQRLAGKEAGDGK